MAPQVICEPVKHLPEPTTIKVQSAYTGATSAVSTVITTVAPQSNHSRNDSSQLTTLNPSHALPPSILPSSTSHSSSSQPGMPRQVDEKAGLIIGCLLGVLTLLAITVFFIIFRLRRSSLKTMPEIVPMLAVAYHSQKSLVANSHHAKPNSGTPSSHVTPQCPPRIWKPRQDRCGGVEAPIMCQSEIGRRIRSVQREVNEIISAGELDVMRRDKELLQDEIRELRSQLQSQRQSVWGTNNDEQPPPYA